MTISKTQVDMMLEMLALTREEEIDCGKCLSQLAEFAENSLAGKSVPEGLVAIEEHLKICGECREEFVALRVALSNEAE